MRTIAGALAFVMAVSSIPSPALAGHLVSPSAVGAALEEAAATGARDRARVEAMLGTSSAQAMAGKLGVDMATVRQAAARLTDAERADLLARAEALAANPAAGHLSADLNQLLVILLIVLIVVVILDAVD